MFSETWGEGKMAQRWGFDHPVTALVVKGWPKFQVYSQKRHRITSVRGPQERGKDIDRCDEPLVVVGLVWGSFWSHWDRRVTRLGAGKDLILVFW